MTNNENAGNRLQRLKNSNYEIADGEPDIRGWDVKDSAGKTIGEVEELIFDEQSRKVRYMVVDLDNNDFDLEEREVLIPIGLAELHKNDDDVLLPGITAEQLKALPEYKDNITSGDEATIRNVLAGTAGVETAYSDTSDTDFYNHGHFKEDNLFKNRKKISTEGTTTVPIIEEQLQVGKRTVETGGSYIKSRIVERPVEETINLQEEHVRVERTPVDRAVDSNTLDTFQEGVVEVNEYAEVPVVAKEARVVEEVTINKDVQERVENIRDTVRKTEVEVEDIKNEGRSAASNLSDEI
jgi:stress response protein YsnF